MTDIAVPQSFRRARAMLVLPLAVAGAALAAGPARAQQPAPGDTLRVTIQDAVARALGQGDEVRLAESRSEAASAQVGQARSTALPALRMNSAFTHVYENARAQAVGQIFNQPNTYNVNFNLSAPLFQGGRISAGLKSARGLRGAAQADVEQARADVTLLVLRAYLDALFSDRLVQIQRENVALAEERVRQVEQLEHAGRASRYDVLRARVERSNLEPLAIRAAGDRDLALLELVRLANLPASQPVKLVSPVSAQAVAALAQAAGAPTPTGDSAAVAAIPSVRAAELRASASRAGIAIARADYLPTLSAFVQSGFQAFPTDWRFPTSRGALDPVACPAGSAADRVCTQQNGGWFTDRSLGLQVSWPVFDGFRTRSNVALARAQAEVARAQAAQAREAAAVQLAQARSDLETARAQFAATRLNVAEAEEAFRLATLRFARGLSTQLDVSDAQLALTTARSNEARATHELYLAAAGLARAQGRPIPLLSAAP
ncbi:MAG TPA: TolC family protein [Longimicrobium sp.]|nr:TolC family protein [Longimicrobium sp.]